MQAYDLIVSSPISSFFPTLQVASGPMEVTTDVDAVILVTSWDALKNLDFGALGKVMQKKIVFDGRRVLNKTALMDAGFIYRALGGKAYIAFGSRC